MFSITKKQIYQQGQSVAISARALGQALGASWRHRRPARGPPSRARGCASPAQACSVGLSSQRFSARAPRGRFVQIAFVLVSVQLGDDSKRRSCSRSVKSRRDKLDCVIVHGAPCRTHGRCAGCCRAWTLRNVRSSTTWCACSQGWERQA